MTTDMFKNGVLRVVGSHFGKMTVLEAELGVRELLRISPPSLRADHALRASYPTTSSSARSDSTQFDDIFDALRSQVMELSTLGKVRPEALAGSSSSGSLTKHLARLIPPPKFPPSITSPHVTFICALYAERCMIQIADYILRSVGRVTERKSATEFSGVAEIETALQEDDSLWSWVKGMRIKRVIEDELKGTAKGKGLLNSAYAKGSLGLAVGFGTPPNGSSLSVARRSTSQDSARSNAGLLYKPNTENNDYDDVSGLLLLIAKTHS